MNRCYRALAACTVLALAACGGGGGSSQSVLPSPGSSGGGGLGSQGVTRVRGTVTIPAPSKLAAARRSVKYISPNTNSLVYKQGTFTTVVPLEAGASGCTTNQDGSRVCSFTASAVPGTAVPFTVSTYQTTDASGAPLSIATMTETIVAGQANTLNLTLNPVVATIGVAISGAAFQSGTAGSQTVTVTAKDGSGATIATGVVGLVDQNGTPAPVTLVDGDTSGATSFAAAGSPQTTLQLTTSTTATLYYGGTGIPNNDVVTATSGNPANAKLATASATIAFISNSLYVLDNAGGRIIEYVLAADGSVAANATPRRIITMSRGGVPMSANCSGTPISPYGGLFVDPSGNIIVALECSVTGASYDDDHYYLLYGPNSEGAQQSTAPIATFTGPSDGASNITFDPSASSNGTDVFYTAQVATTSADPGIFFTTSYTPPGTSATATASMIGGTPGMPPSAGSQAQPGFYNDPILASNGNFFAPFVLNETSGFPNALFRTSLPLAGGSPEAPTASITGDATQLGYNGSSVMNEFIGDGMAAANGFLYLETDSGNDGPTDAAGDGANALEICTTTYSQPTFNSTCADSMYHTTLLAYNLNTLLAATGTSTVTPTFGIAGVPMGSTATAGLGCSINDTFNLLAAYKTKVYVANQTGSTCASTPNTSAAPFNSEVDIFETSGLNGPTNSVVPIALKNSSVFPSAVAIGPTGTATSSVTTLSVSQRASQWPNLRTNPLSARRLLRTRLHVP